jgi:hypothetical protein
MSPILIENADTITRGGFRGGVRALWILVQLVRDSSAV